MSVTKSPGASLLQNVAELADTAGCVRLSSPCAREHRITSDKDDIGVSVIVFPFAYLRWTTAGPVPFSYFVCQFKDFARLLCMFLGQDFCFFCAKETGASWQAKFYEISYNSLMNEHLITVLLL